MRLPWSRCVLPVLAGLLLCVGGWRQAAAQSVEQQLKAVFIYRFAQYVEWPEAIGKTGELALCTLGEDVFDGALSSIEGKTVGDRRIAVRPISKPDKLGQCHIVFVSLPLSDRMTKAVITGRGAHLLTISDQPGFAVAGGMIELIKMNDRLQFDINLGAVREADLRISAHLLKLAHVVQNR